MRRPGAGHGKRPARGATGVKPTATSAAPTRTTPVTDCGTLPVTCPVSTEPRWTAIVRRRAMTSPVMSSETETAIAATVPPVPALTGSSKRRAGRGRRAARAGCRRRASAGRGIRRPG
ncbi:hypothetical protein GCM10015536_07510 [Streptomyces griseomycini]|nr:hypothetical protein GCM10015536_07510 [Streptomyces griseomycini]